eukprot:TRINITY_DN9956_c0_g1_i2.p1 TRINITY_DN9956_c0_g1~~TRINITY_DN9956_c0_g1_i2.p1  ORF type:complete len:405 (-),score=43.56 TRINITY_DN9956_c0_g1_i2:12-1133(-)
MAYVTTSDKGLNTFDSAATKAFLARRIVRLCPAYFAALVWLSALSMVGCWGQQPFAAWPASAIFVQSLLPFTICGSGEAPGARFFLPYGANFCGWFVSSLLVVTLCFPLMYNIRPRSGPVATASLLVVVVVLRSVPTALEMLNDFPCLGERFEDGFCKASYVFAPVRLFEFGAGMLAAQLCDELPAHMAAWVGWGATFDLSSCLALALFLAVHHVKEANEYFATGLCCLICMSARCEGLKKQVEGEETVRGPGRLGRLLSIWPLAKLSQYSYGAYIFSLAVLVSRPKWPHSDEQSCWLWLLVVDWGVAAVSAHLMENPLAALVELRLKGDEERQRQGGDEVSLVLAEGSEAGAGNGGIPHDGHMLFTMNNLLS